MMLQLLAIIGMFLLGIWCGLKAYKIGFRNGIVEGRARQALGNKTVGLKFIKNSPLLSLPKDKQEVDRRLAYHEFLMNTVLQLKR